MSGKKDTKHQFLHICSSLIQKTNPRMASIYTAQFFPSLDLQPANNYTNASIIQYLSQTHHINANDGVTRSQNNVTSGLNRDMGKQTQQ